MHISILMNVGSTENQLWRRRRRRCKEAHVRLAGRTVAFKLLGSDRDQVGVCTTSKTAQLASSMKVKGDFFSFLLAPMLTVVQLNHTTSHTAAATATFATHNVSQGSVIYRRGCSLGGGSSAMLPPGGCVKHWAARSSDTHAFTTLVP